MRWLPLLCAVMLLHFFTLYFAFSQIANPFLRSETVPTIVVDFLPFPEPALVRPRIVPAPEATADTHLLKPVHKIAPPTIKTLGSTSSPVSDSASSSASEEVKLGRNLPTYQIDAPPSAELKFSMQQLRGLWSETGIGVIRWTNRGAYYNILVALQVPESDIQHFASDGVFDHQGISPLSYLESRNDKAEAKTQFHRERNTISFSTSTESHPRLGGEQDTASVIWQLAGIGRRDAKAFKTDVDFQMFVAGASKADVWLIRVIGLEDIETPLGKIQAWHLVRAAPAGSKEQSLDLWLAPEKEWYPVKLRYTEANGDTLDLLISEITPVPDT